MAAGEYADVVREAQELVELALKGMLRWGGIDPPRWHDVGAILLQYRERLPAEIHAVLPEIAKASARLRREREAAFYGEIDLIPGQSYDLASVQQALNDADRILAALDFFETH